MTRARLIKAQQVVSRDSDREPLNQKLPAKGNCELSSKALTPEEIVSQWTKSRDDARQINPRALFASLFSPVRG